ncbi:MAG: helix-turn-helix transcriptional regulator [Lachnospiraceae bacterium]|nr:helix-turn-helix transcriptional regulator [Lachnospiraceae bacterium]
MDQLSISDIDYLALGCRIKSARKRLGLTQAQLAQAAQLATNNISNIERGQKRVSLGKLVQIANVLGVGVDELLCDSLVSGEKIYEKRTDSLLEDLSRDEREYAMRMLEYTIRCMQGYSIHRVGNRN